MYWLKRKNKSSIGIALILLLETNYFRVPVQEIGLFKMGVELIVGTRLLINTSKILSVWMWQCFCQLYLQWLIFRKVLNCALFSHLSIWNFEIILAYHSISMYFFWKTDLYTGEYLKFFFPIQNLNEMPEMPMRWCSSVLFV